MTQSLAPDAHWLVAARLETVRLRETLGGLTLA